ncbi:hypothetical protein H0E87_024566 [Populus deltoides]|uniref:SWIM-type domain-containing protein n=1 Tax=Populus deltoides TaxID=3696 RepID=A0A8T2X5V4_POPDE|nr:hypothetical protein H0E87_024566 [Populus deltoides]
MNNLIVICQSGGKFSTASDGSLSYVGGDAHAISVSRETKFDELRLEIADMWKYGTDSMTIKYFLPNNKRTLITISSDKDVQRFLDFHGNSGTVDVFVIKNESSTALAAVTPSTTEATPVPPRKRSTRKRVIQQEYPLNVTPVAQAPAPAFLASASASASENAGRFNSLATVPTEIQSGGQMKRVKLWENCITGLHQQFNNVREVRDAFRKYSIAQGFTIKFKKNDSMRVSAKCSVDGCPWRIFASRLSTTHLFRIKRLNEIHTCGAALPIIKIIETIRHKLMELIYTRKVESDQWLTRLTPSVEDKLQKEILKAQSLQVMFSPSNTFEVQDFLGAVNVVNIDAWDCSCREWQLNGFPCLHAVAVLQHIGRDVYDYCSKYYTTEAFRLTYSESIKPVPTVDKPVLGESSEVQVNPSPLRRVSGSPKKRRIRSRGVVKRPLHCSRCKGEGHNKVSCNVVS